MKTANTNIVIDLLEDSVVITRILNNIEKITNTEICINSWYSIVNLMGLNLEKSTNKSDYVIQEYNKVFDSYLDKVNSNRDTAILIYNNYENLIESHLQKSPFLKS